MKKTLLPEAVLTLTILLICIGKGYSQSRSGIGFGYGINKPYSSDYGSGRGFMLFGNIAIGDKWALVHSIGFERLNSKGRTIYDPSGFPYTRISSVDFGYMGLSGKYYITQNIFAKAGATLYIGGGNEDIVGIGIGGSVAAGYSLPVGSHGSFDLTFNTDLANLEFQGDGTTLFAGLKIAYVFNFRKRVN